jgi:glycosyltransferase involved in cell wall biosynthesis
MKIVLVHNRYREAGGEDVVFETEKRLLERAGHLVIAYERSNHEVNDGSALGLVGVVPQMLWSSNTRRQFAAILDEWRPDIIHVHNTFMVISPSIYSACSQRKIPVVQTLHNFRLLCPAGTFFRDGVICNECVDQTLLQSVRYSCYRNSRAATAGVALMLGLHRALDTWPSCVTRFIALTQFAKEKFVEGGFPSDKFVVKPNFADPDPNQRSGRGECGVFVGRLNQNKGVRVLLNAWNLLPRQYPLHIVGNGPERAALEHFWPLLSCGGLVLLDDYANCDYPYQKQVMDDAARGLKAEILALPTGQGLLMK